MADLSDIEDFNEAVNLNDRGEIELGEAWPIHTKTARVITALEALEMCAGYAHPSVVHKTLVDYWTRNATDYRELIQQKIQERENSTLSARAHLRKSGPRFITENFFITYSLGSGLDSRHQSKKVPPGTVPAKAYSFYLGDVIDGRSCAKHVSNMQQRRLDVKRLN